MIQRQPRPEEGLLIREDSDNWMILGGVSRRFYINAGLAVALVVATAFCVIEWWPSVFIGVPLLAVLLLVRKPHYDQARTIVLDKVNGTVSIKPPLGLGRGEDLPLDGIEEVRLRYFSLNTRAELVFLMKGGTEVLVFRDASFFIPYMSSLEVLFSQPTLADSAIATKNEEPLRIARFLGVPMRKILFSDRPEGELERNQEVFLPADELP